MKNKTTDNEQKSSQGVNMRKRIAQGAKLDGKSLGGTPVKTRKQ